MKTTSFLKYFNWLILLVAAMIFQLFLPWWSIAIAAFAFGYIVNQRYPFLNGFTAIFMLWTVYATWISYTNEGLLAGKLAVLLGVSYAFVPVILTGITGGLTGGFASLAGHYLKLSVKAK
jgi:hypothetical protein